MFGYFSGVELCKFIVLHISSSSQRNDMPHYYIFKMYKRIYSVNAYKKKVVQALALVFCMITFHLK